MSNDRKVEFKNNIQPLEESKARCIKWTNLIKHAVLGAVTIATLATPSWALRMNESQFKQLAKQMVNTHNSKFLSKPDSVSTLYSNPMFHEGQVYHFMVNTWQFELDKPDQLLVTIRTELAAEAYMVLKGYSKAFAARFVQRSSASHDNVKMVWGQVIGASELILTSVYGVQEKSVIPLVRILDVCDFNVTGQTYDVECTK
jgi:hypothetical protein